MFSVKPRLKAAQAGKSAQNRGLTLQFSQGTQLQFNDLS
jgi:hypothetical protein